MKVSYNWLKEYVDFDFSPQELADELTESGIEVEELYPLVKPFSGVVVARVETVEKHPNADKLFVCRVHDGNETFQVICGAPNVAQGQYVPFARLGALLPGNFHIKKAKLRGVESSGMICSREELGLERSSDGIWAFESPLELGRDVYALLEEEQDYIFDLFITPNRPDCLSMVGIAREISAIVNKPLRLPEFQLKESSGPSIESQVSLNIEDTKGCPRYAARIVTGISVSASPHWMQNRLESVGVRPINNIVDVTNYVLMELGHPLHAFDLDQLQDQQINVRASRPGEKFTTLDEKNRDLPEDTVMICDGQRPVAIGGIMGGLNSEVTGNTKAVLLEAAYFNPNRISKSSKKMGLTSEAAHRFERGVDPNGVILALNRASALIAELTGGQITAGICDEYPESYEPQEIFFRTERVNRVLGSEFSDAEIIQTLKRLQLDVHGKHVLVPTFRVDLKEEIDLVEEVARLIRYSSLPSAPVTHFPYDLPAGITNRNEVRLREEMLHLGFSEALPNSMLRPSEAAPFLKGDAVTILNPVSDDMKVMRPSLLPGLLKAVAYNINRNIEDVQLFEIGRVFRHKTDQELPDQPYQLAAVMTGLRQPFSWNAENVNVDFYDVKGAAETLFGKIYLDNVQIILYDESSPFEGGETVRFLRDKQALGICGRIHPEVCQVFGIEQPVYAFEFDLSLISGGLDHIRQYREISRFPHVEKDMALVIDEQILAQDVLNFVKKTGGDLLKSVDIFDLFKGKSVPAGKKSLAVRMRFQAMDRTLSDNEIDQIFKKMIKDTLKQFSANLRT